VSEEDLGDWWDDVERLDLADKRGCYVFGMRQGRGTLPVYVGMTSSQTFRSECFNARNVKELNKLLAHRGTLILFLVAPVGRGRTGKNTIKDVERHLIEVAVRRNPDLLNRRGVPKPLWIMNGIGGVRTRGRLSRSAQELARVLGVS
jgi:hypothetical protein